MIRTLAVFTLAILLAPPAFAQNAAPPLVTALDWSAWDVTADPDNRVLYGDVDVHRAVAEKKGVVGQVYAKISEKGIEPLFGWCYVEPVRKTTTFMEYSGEELLEDRGILRFAEDGSLIGKMVFFPSECASVNSVNGVNYYVLEHKMIVAYED